jgi:beta-galactosidase
MVIGGQWRLNEEAGLTECADIVGYNGGAFHSRVDGKAPYDLARENHPERIHLLSEGVLNRDDPPMRGDWEDENTYWKGLAQDWSDIYSRNWFCGGSMWVFAAYSACGTYRCRGMMDMWRLPNEGYYFFRSQWNPEPMVHIACHWSWQVAEGDVREVTVFHNAENVELFLDDTSLGTCTPDPSQFPGLPHPPATWQVPFRPGCLRAVIRQGTDEISDVRYTEGDAAALRWRSETDELVGDGQDIAFLVAEIVDDQGHRCYTATPELTLSINGPARIAGPTTLVLRGGRARFAVRSSTGAGTIRVRGMVANLPPAEVQLQATTEH